MSIANGIQNQARGLRREEETNESRTDSNSQHEAGGISQNPRTQQVGIGGTDSARGNSPIISKTVNGGILSQMISDARDQLAEARECITWYQRQEQKSLERIQHLETLQKLEREENQE